MSTESRRVSHTDRRGAQQILLEELLKRVKISVGASCCLEIIEWTEMEIENMQLAICQSGVWC